MNSLSNTIQYSSQWSDVPFGAGIHYKPIFQKDKHRLHQFGKKMVPGIFMECVLHTVGAWTSDLLISDWEDIENHTAATLTSKGSSRKKMESLQYSKKHIVPCVDCWSPRTSRTRRSSNSPSQATSKTDDEAEGKPANKQRTPTNTSCCPTRGNGEPRRFLERIGTFYLPSSCSTLRSATRSERVIVPDSSEVNRREVTDENKPEPLGGEQRELERRRQRNSPRRLDRFHSFPYPLETHTTELLMGKRKTD